MQTVTFIRFCLPSMLVLLFSLSAYAADCSGPWRVLPNYSPGSGGACAALGLNTHQPTCQPGQRFATLCDDASGGRYRTCQSSISCRHNRPDEYHHTPNKKICSDYRGRRWDDSRLGRIQPLEYCYEPTRPHRKKYRRPSFDCTQWDFSANRRCAPGMINRDCRFGCDTRVH